MHRATGFLWQALMAALLATAGGGAQGQSSSVTFDVPVRVQNMPTRFTSGIVDCQVFADSAGSTPVGSGAGRFQLTRGAFSGTVTVVATSRDRDVGRGRAYQCRLGLSDGTTTLDIRDCSEPGNPSFREECRPADGTRAIGMSGGTF